MKILKGVSDSTGITISKLALSCLPSYINYKVFKTLKPQDITFDCEL